jgi:hypothetical protein
VVQFIHALHGQKITDKNSEKELLLKMIFSGEIMGAIYEDFHKHLDVCDQCSNNPFSLCPEGARIMQGTSDKIFGVIPKETKNGKESN